MSKSRSRPSYLQNEQCNQRHYYIHIEQENVSDTSVIDQALKQHIEHIRVLGLMIFGENTHSAQGRQD